jgi:ABC-type uncharacterized transport system involved in gliding motility auxiliary subunit
MSNVRTILRRDLGAYFTSPIGYIFIMVFITISVGLYITSFFTFPVADMRSYFGNLPLLMCVFIPAVTMRVWAEERKENTWEMLLTFPMKSWELVIGKFLATFVFFLITLAGTLTVPIMLAVLGNPDNGAIFGGYLGTILLGAFFLSIGIFFSGFCRDQIVAFVITLLACFLIFLLGTDFIATILDGYVSGLGTLLGTLLGMIDHYSTFTRGVLEFADVLYFVVWTVLFLVLNILFIEGRNRPGSRMTFATAVTLCFGIGLAFNWLVSDLSLLRRDLTEDKVYTISPATEKILSGLESPVNVKVYITPESEMPTALKSLEQDVTDKLAEMRVKSGGMLDFTPVYLKAANVLASQEDLLSPESDEEEGESSETEAIEKRMLDKGVRPFMVQALVAEEFTQKPVYSSIGISYRENKEEIIPQVMPENIPELEYRLVNTIYKLTRETPPKVALVAPMESVNIPPQMRQIYMQLGQPIPEQDDPYEYLQAVLEVEKYEVERVQLTQDNPLPAEYDTLVVVNPRELNERQKWEINRALISGKSVVLAVQNYMWDYQTTQTGRLNLTKQDQNPQVNDLLEKYGLGVSRDILMDVNQVALTIRSSANTLAALLGGGETIKLPMHMLINNESMNPDSAITNRLPAIFYLWGTAVDLNNDVLAKNGLDAEVIASTSSRAWEIPENEQLSQQSIEGPESGEAYPVMAKISGTFPDAFAGQERPSWPPPEPTPGMPPQPPMEEDGEVAPVTPAPAELVLLGCSQMFHKNFLQAGNLDLFLNCVDAVTLGDDIVNVRGRKPIDRIIEKPTDRQRAVWKFVNYALVNVLVAAMGITVWAVRKKGRDAYTMAHNIAQKKAA